MELTHRKSKIYGGYPQKVKANSIILTWCTFSWCALTQPHIAMETELHPLETDDLHQKKCTKFKFE